MKVAATRPGHGFPDRLEAEALGNARLIAAAPELFAIVAELARKDPVYAKAFDRQRIAEARALVARVEGRADG